MATEDRWHDFVKEKPSEDMEGRDFIVSNGYSDTLSMWCGGYWENEPFMGNKLCDEVVRWKGYLTPEEEKANEATRTELEADKTFVFGEECEAYKKSDVDELLDEKDATIAELKDEIAQWKDKCHDIDDSWNEQTKEIAELKKQLHNLCAQSMDVSGKTIDKVSELMAENERLTNALKDERQFGLEIARNADHTIALDNEKLCDKEKELRATRRALWLARAKRANEHYHRYHGRFLPDIKLTDIPEYNKWIKVEKLCRAKAEEYK